MPLFFYSDTVAASAAFISHLESSTNTTTFTFSMDCGGGGTIIGCFSHRGIGTATAVTIGGQTAGNSRTGAGGTVGTGIWLATGVPSGTQNVVLTLSAASNGGATAAVYLASGVISTTPTATADSAAATPTSGSIDVPANGFLIGVAASVTTGANSTSTWGGTAGILEDCDNNYDASSLDVRSTAHVNTVPALSAVVASCSFTNTPITAHGNFAAWGPT